MVNEAIRDEGASFHYGAPSADIRTPTEDIVEPLIAELSERVGFDAVKPSAKREGAPLTPPSTPNAREPKVRGEFGGEGGIRNSQASKIAPEFKNRPK